MLKSICLKIYHTEVDIFTLKKGEGQIVIALGAEKMGGSGIVIDSGLAYQLKLFNSECLSIDGAYQHSVYSR